MLRGSELFKVMQPHVEHCLGGGGPLGVLMLGLYGLRQFNIQHGYEQGERLVARVHALAREALRPGDQVLQVAPGEFILLLPGLRDDQHAMLAASRLLRQFEQPLDLGGLPVLASVAVGIATCPVHGDSPDELCRHAEAALGLAQASADRMAVGPALPKAAGIDPAELREAIQGGQLELHFQPIWDLQAGRVAGAEALARWTHPRLGPVSPGLFVPLAESTGIIAELTRWSLNAILQHVVEARKRGMHLPVSLNLSAVAFAERGLVEQLLGALRLWDVEPAALVIEVTETAIISDLENGARILGRLGAEGIRVAIDDFGVGNASFAYLRQFPATELKIDRSFVTGMLGDVRSMMLVKAMVDFAHHLGMRVVAEGVEDRSTLQKLAEMDCDFAQGYVLGHAKPAGEFIAGLAAGA